MQASDSICNAGILRGLAGRRDSRCIKMRRGHTCRAAESNRRSRRLQELRRGLRGCRLSAIGSRCVQRLQVLEHAQWYTRLLEVIDEDFLIRVFVMTIAHKDSMIAEIIIMRQAVTTPIVTLDVRLRPTVKQEPCAWLLRKITLIEGACHHAVMNFSNQLPPSLTRQVLHIIHVSEHAQRVLQRNEQARMLHRQLQ